MREIKVVFSRPKSKFAIVSFLIRLLEKSSFSHVAIRLYSASLNKDLVYQASHGMVHFVSGDRFDDTSTTVKAYSIKLNEQSYKNLVRKCIALAGTKYGTLQLIGMGLERILGIINPFRDGPKTFVCSELVGTLLEADIDLEYIGPAKLCEYVAKLPNSVELK